MLLDEHYLKYTQSITADYKSFRKNNFDARFIESYRLWKSYRNNRLYEWQSNVFLPYAFSLIETVLPREVEYLWRGDSLVKAFPREPNDIEYEGVVNDLIQYQTDTQIKNLFLEFVEHLKQTLIYGTAIGMLTWDVENNRPDFFSMDILDFYGQPYKKYIEDMDILFRVYDKNVDELYNKQKMGIGYKNIEKLFDKKNVAASEESKKRKLETTGQSQASEPRRPTALIHEYWGKFPVQETIDLDSGLNTTRYEEMVVMVANGDTLIRMMPNPYRSVKNPKGFKPFIVGKNYIDVGEFYALGELDSIKDLQHESNELENQSLDNIKLIMNRMWKVSTNAGVDLSTLTSIPGGVVIANDINQVTQMDHNDIPQSSLEAKSTLERIMDKASGVSDYSRGGNAPGMTDTVGGISSLVEEANMRFSLKIKILQQTTIKQFAEKLFMLDQLFIKNAILPIRLSNNEGYKWLEINQDNLQGMYDFKPVGISMIGNRIARQNTLNRMLEVLAKAPPIPSLIRQMLAEAEFTNIEEIMAEMYKLWGIPNPALPQEDPMLAGSGSIPPSPVQPAVGNAAGAGINPQTLQPTMPPSDNAGEMQALSKLVAAGMR